jgi:hypothetical protein
MLKKCSSDSQLLLLLLLLIFRVGPQRNFGTPNYSLFWSDQVNFFPTLPLGLPILREYLPAAAAMTVGHLF